MDHEPISLVIVEKGIRDAHAHREWSGGLVGSDDIVVVTSTIAVFALLVFSDVVLGDSETVVGFVFAVLFHVFQKEGSLFLNLQ